MPDKNIVPQPFEPDADWVAELELNRSGQLTRSQKNTIRIAAVGSVTGLGCILVLLVNVGLSLLATFKILGAGTLFFFLLFLLTFGYMGFTLFFNARWYLPDLINPKPVAQSKGKLQVRMAERHRDLLPFSYIVGEYSFAPFEVPHGVPMEKGREYRVYYGKTSRIFLNIEPVDYKG